MLSRGQAQITTTHLRGILIKHFWKLTIDYHISPTCVRLTGIPIKYTADCDCNVKQFCCRLHWIKWIFSICFSSVFLMPKCYLRDMRKSQLGKHLPDFSACGFFSTKTHVVILVCDISPDIPEVLKQISCHRAVPAWASRRHQLCSL